MNEVHQNQLHLQISASTQKNLTNTTLLGSNVNALHSDFLGKAKLLQQLFRM